METSELTFDNRFIVLFLKSYFYKFIIWSTLIGSLLTLSYYYSHKPLIFVSYTFKQDMATYKEVFNLVNNLSILDSLKGGRIIALGHKDLEFRFESELDGELKEKVKNFIVLLNKSLTQRKALKAKIVNDADFQILQIEKLHNKKFNINIMPIVGLMLEADSFNIRASKLQSDLSKISPLIGVELVMILYGLLKIKNTLKLDDLFIYLSDKRSRFQDAINVDSNNKYFSRFFISIFCFEFSFSSWFGLVWHLVSKTIN